MLNNIFKTFASCTVFILASSSYAGTVAQEQQQLKQYQSEITELSSVNEDIDQNIDKLKQDVAKLKKKMPAIEAAYLEQQQALKDAEALAKESPNSSSEGKAKNASFKFYLAERKYKKLDNSIAQAEQQLSEMQVAQASNSKQIEQNKSRIIISTEYINKLKADQKNQLQASEAAQSRRQQELRRVQRDQLAAEKEIEALREQLRVAELKAQSTAKQVAQPSARPAFPDAVVETAVVAEVIKPEVSAVPTLITNSNDATSISRALDQRIAADNSRSKKINKILHIKTYSNNELVKQSSHTMKYLSNDQYRAKAQVRPGTNKLIIGSNSWTVEIPAEDKRDNYYFILDNRESSSPDFKAYNSSLVK
jgi:chromosome segregation ATPase